MFVKKSNSRSTWQWKLGPMRDYLWKNNIHGLRERQIAGQKYSADKKTNTTKELIFNAIVNLENLNIKNIASTINKTTNTIRRYLKKYTHEFKFAFLKRIKKRGGVDIRVNFASMILSQDLMKYFFKSNRNLEGVLNYEYIFSTENKKRGSREHQT